VLRIPVRAVQALALSAALATPASAQYRRHVENLAPMFAATVSLGALFPYDETITPVETPTPEENRRGVREVGAAPWLSAEARYGRGIAVYANAGGALPGEADLSGTDPLTGEVLEGTDDVGLVYHVSVGASVAPLRDVMGLRLDIGPAWLDLGSGAGYLALRVAASAKFFEIGDNGGVLLAWDGFFAGGQHDRDGIEYQIRGGLITGVRVGFELTH
jgi:hypothetical protein